MEVRILCGFNSIKLNVSKRSATEKARKLVESGHVIHVEEIQSSESSVITGYVIRQTSTSRMPYKVQLKVNKLYFVIIYKCQ